MRLRGLKIEEDEFVPEFISCEAPVILGNLLIFFHFNLIGVTAIF